MTCVPNQIEYLLSGPSPFYLLLSFRMDFGDVASGELHNGALPVVGLIGSNQDLYSSRFRFSKRVGEIGDFISRRLPPIRIREMTIRHENSHVAKL